ncbi:MAG: hypothetical protein H0W74_13780 [Sphingosinicella sp.]|nr:hypothetical protein [Sphingosinicella sp.]
MEKVKEVDPSKMVQRILEDDAAQVAATPDQTCQMGIVVYGGIAKLPLEQAATVAAFMLKSGMEP